MTAINRTARPPKAHVTQATGAKASSRDKAVANLKAAQAVTEDAITTGLATGNTAPLATIFETVKTAGLSPEDVTQAVANLTMETLSEPTELQVAGRELEAREAKPEAKWPGVKAFKVKVLVYELECPYCGEGLLNPAEAESYTFSESVAFNGAKCAGCGVTSYVPIAYRVVQA